MHVNLDHLIVDRAEQQRRHAAFKKSLNPMPQPEQPPPPPPPEPEPTPLPAPEPPAAAPSFADDGARIRWMRDQCLLCAGWESRERLVLRLGSIAFEITEAWLVSNNRKQKTVRPRQKVMAFAHIVCGLSLTRIGKQFRRDHTTVLHGVNKFRSLIVAALNESENVKDENQPGQSRY
jgi:DnaA-like protein